ncbi:MAG: hypothetical protein J6V10_02305 [Clostridia bacterium]|nr:hypothetical protein [Clostridia bacterium]
MKAETKQKLKPFVTVAVASVVTLAVYLLSSVVLVAIFREIEDKTLRALINAVIVTAAFGFILLYIAKIRNSAGEDEAISDCGARDSIPLAEELKTVLKRERSIYIWIGICVLFCLIVNTLTKAVFQKDTDSFIVFPFVPMYVFDSAISVPVVGYLISALCDCALYTGLLLIFRKRWLRKRKTA